MRKLMRCLLLAFFTLISTNTEANPLFNKIFTNWTTAFNNKDLPKSCELFSKKLVADYQGTPQKNYHSVCDGFKKIFKIKNQDYRYSFNLHQVYQADNIAAVRITWYLRIYTNKKLQSLTQDEGIDIFEKNKEGQWKIVNYIGYENKSCPN